MSRHVESQLADYVHGRLVGDQNTEVKKHLDECTECGADYRWILAFREDGRAEGVHHLTPERIVDIAKAADADTLEQHHLKGCQDCMSELAWVRENTREEAHPQLLEIPESSEGRRPFPVRALWAAGLAAAAMLTVFLLIPREAGEESIATLAELSPLSVSVTRAHSEPGTFEAHLTEGLNRYADGNYVEAHARLQEALGIRPDHEVALLYSASSSLFTGRPQEAEAVLIGLRQASLATVRTEARWLSIQSRLLQEDGAGALALLDDLSLLPERHRSDARTLRERLRTGRE